MIHAGCTTTHRAQGSSRRLSSRQVGMAERVSRDAVARIVAVASERPCVLLAHRGLSITVSDNRPLHPELVWTSQRDGSWKVQLLVGYEPQIWEALAQ